MESGFRLSPSDKAEIVDWIPEGSVLLVEKRIGNYFEVDYQGRKGYINEGQVHPDYR